MDKQELLENLHDYGIECSVDEINLLEDYMHYILKCNEEVNLTAIKNESDFREKMILDSALPLKLISFSNKKVLDIGTGAGFPGVVLSFLSSADVTVIDSTSKKIGVIKNYPYIDVTAISSRAEEYIKTKREKFDIVVARAVAPLNILAELCLPFVKIGGYFIALKGSEGEKELFDATRAITVLGGKISNIDSFKLPSGESRVNILINKIESCHKKYPREYSIIKSKPL